MVEGNQLGGGYIEKCRQHKEIWEIRAIYSRTLAREFFGFDGKRIVLLHGYVKRTGQAASTRDFRKASTYWKEYNKIRRVSPVQ